MKTEEAIGWGLRVGGPRPYLSWVIRFEKEEIKTTEPYHRAVRVALVPLAEWKRLKRLDTK